MIRKQGNILKEYSTNNDHFVFFKKQCQFWIQRYGLFNWRVYYTHEKLEDCFAATYFNILGRAATITLSTTFFGMEPNERFLDIVAFHEITHLLFGRMDCAAKSRNMQYDEFDECVHEAIRILENVLYLQLTDYPEEDNNAKEAS